MTRRTVFGSEPSTSEIDAEGLLEVVAPVRGYPGWWATVRVDYGVDPPAVVELTVARRADPVKAAVERMGGKVVDTGPAPEVAPTLTADLLRSVRLDDFAQAINQHGARHQTPTPDVDPRKFPPGSDQHYAAFAARYVSRVAAGSRRPNADLAEELGLRSSQVRDLIFACRKKGFLTAGAAGRSVGVLTDEALAILEAEKPQRRKTRRK